MKWRNFVTDAVHYAVEPSQKFDFASADGLRIACARWEGSCPVRGVIQIAHGMGEHYGRYGQAIIALAAAGFTVYANDHRGHGRSVRSANELGDFGDGGFDLLVEDMLRLTEVARGEHPGLPRILFGHSMGSFASQLYAIDHSAEIDGLILSGSGILDGLARAALMTPPGVNVLNAPFEPARTPFDWLSRDPAMADAFIADPLCFAELNHRSLASFLSVGGRLSDPTLIARVRVDLPIYIFSGSDDPVGQQGAGVETLVKRYREAGLTEITSRIYPGGRHEMLNEINRDEVVADLLGWLDRNFPTEDIQ